MMARAIIAVVLALGLAIAPADSGAQLAGKPLPRIGYLSGGSESGNDAAFRQGLRDLGYLDGQTVVIESRFAEGRYEHLAGYAAELVRSNVAVIVAATTPGIRAAQQATQTIPIVMTFGEASEGAVVSLARPGGNVTGMSTVSPELGGKRLELLKEALPKLSRVAVLQQPANPMSRLQMPPIDAAARALGVQVHVFEVKSVRDLEEAFDAAVRKRADALMGLPDHLFNIHRDRVAELSLRHRLPAMYWTATLPKAGCLMSYGPNIPALSHRAAVYVDKILKGAKPAELPIERPTKFDLVINLKTAKALGLTIPRALVVRADEIIQ